MNAAITAEAQTISQLLADATLRLAHSDSPRLDAEVLLAHALKQTRRFFYAHPEFIPDAETQSQFSRLLAQRIDGVPVAYLTGTREFWSLPLKVSDATLIPRADTERLVEVVLDIFAEKNSLSLLDLGTGTGAIALAIASERPDWQVLGIDLMPPAVNLAQENAQRLAIHNAQFFQSDWFAGVAKNSLERFDIIVSNPPYIAEDDQHLTEGDLRFEPHTALVANQNGLADLEKIISDATAFLNPAGYVFVEHGWQQAEQVRELFRQHSYVAIQTWQDYGGNERVTGGQRL